MSVMDGARLKTSPASLDRGRSNNPFRLEMLQLYNSLRTCEKLKRDINMSLALKQQTTKERRI